MIGASFNYSGGFATTAGEAEFPILWNQLAAYWSPIAQAGGTRIITLGRIRHTGNLTSMAGSNFVPSEIGTAIRFDGVNDYIPIDGNFQPLTPSTSGPFTYSAWVRPANTTAAMGIIKLGDDLTTNGCIGLYLNVLGGGQFSLECAGNKGVRTGAGAMVANRWQHVCVTRGDTWNLYIDGVNQAIATQTAAPVLSWVGREWIGRFASAGDFFNGQIGEIGFWTRWMPGRMVKYLSAGHSPLEPHRRIRRYYFDIPQVAGVSTGRAVVARFPRLPSPALNESRSRYPHLWRGLAGAWNPTYTNPGGTLKDFGPFGMNMALTNTPVVSCEFGRALSFNGTTSTCIAPLDRPRFDGIGFWPLCGQDLPSARGAEFTISTWIKPASIFQPCGVVKWGGKSDGSGGLPATLFLNHTAGSSGQFSLCYYRVASSAGAEMSWSSGQGLFQTDQWVHLAATMVPFISTGSGIRPNAIGSLYLNGLPVTATPLGDWNGEYVIDTRSLGNGEPMMFGAEGVAAPTRRYAGLMGETLIWSRALSNNEIMQVFNGASPLEPKQSATMFGVSIPEPPEPEQPAPGPCVVGMAGRFVRLRRARSSQVSNKQAKIVSETAQEPSLPLLCDSGMAGRFVRLRRLP